MALHSAPKFIATTHAMVQFDTMAVATVNPPGPRGHFLFGDLSEFARDVLGFHLRMREQFGDIVRVRVGNRTIYLINSPELINEVLVTQQRNFIKHSFFWRHVTAIFGKGLVTNEGESWLRQRRLMAPAFHRERIASYAETMVSHTESMVARWGDDEIRDVHHDMMAVTLKIVAEVLFNADVDEDITAVHESFDAVTREIAARFRRPIFVADWVPIPGNLRYRRGVDRLNQLVFRIIREHHQTGAQGGDLLSMLMQVRDEHGSRMSDEQLRDEAVTLLLAGHETTALALSWAFYLLSLHADVTAKLEEELHRELGSRRAGVYDLGKLRYTEAVVQEAMRVFPPAYGIGREAVNDCTIGGYHVPAGTTIFMSAWVVHRDPRFYEEPNAFRPERWLDGLADRLPRHAYMPFGGGPRICIGNNFAMMEAVLLLATITQRFRFERIDAAPVEPFPSITLRPNGGVQLRCIKRSAVS